MTSTLPWPHMGSSPEEQLGSALPVETKRALFSELVKLAEQAPVVQEEPKKGNLGNALKAMGVGAAGIGVGYGLSELAVRNLPVFHTVAQQETARKIILPILSGVAGMLAERYRQKLNEEYRKVPGYTG